MFQASLQSSEYKSETYCWTQKLNKEDYGVDQDWVLLGVVKEQILLKNKKHGCVHLTILQAKICY